MIVARFKKTHANGDETYESMEFKTVGQAESWYLLMEKGLQSFTITEFYIENPIHTMEK